MELKFYGAAKEVTGSCHMLLCGGKRVLVDCGLQQGKDEKEGQEFPFSANEIDSVLITHAHIDHSGRLPLLVKRGFQGPVYATKATCDLLRIMLCDSAYIQESDAKWKNQKGKRSGKKPVEPLYTIEDAQKALKLLVPCSYHQDVKIFEGMHIRFTDAGHLLGSACISILITEDGVTKRVVFSGDIGNLDQPIIRDPEYLRQADYVVMESTYGDKFHDRAEDYTLALAEICEKTFSANGNVIIPSFAVGRTQELLYLFREIKEQNLVKGFRDFPVYVDSPLAAEATKIYSGNLEGYGDGETDEIRKQGIEPISFRNLRISQTTEDSRALNQNMEPKVIISSSGMCEAGRIRHHLKHNLWRQECAVVFVGYQAAGTLGRSLMNGASKVKLFGEEIAVKAQIYRFQGLSAHADKQGLLRWLGTFDPKPGNVFAVHGEADVCTAFADDLKALGFHADAPGYGGVFDLDAGVFLDFGIPPVHKTRDKGSRTAAFQRLVSSGNRLFDVIQKNSGGTNKDLERFAAEIEALCVRWKITK